MTTKLLPFCLLLACLPLPGRTAPDENFQVYLCFGQSNMEGFPGIPDSEKAWTDPRFQVLAAVDFPALRREQGHWYTAVPPLCHRMFVGPACSVNQFSPISTELSGST